MEESSVLLCKGLTPCQGLLLTASLFTFWHLSTTATVTPESVPCQVTEKAIPWKCGPEASSAKPTIELVPPIVAEGRSVLLFVHNLPEKFAAFVWFKGTASFENMLAIRNPLEKKPTEWGPAYSRREILRPDGSLLITRVSQKDHGSYILKIIKRDMKVAEARVQLQVDASRSLLCHPLISSKLVIQPVPQSVAEGKAVLLQVYNLPEDWRAFFWYKSKDEIPVLKIVDHNRAIKSISWGPEQRSGMVYNNGSLVLQDVIGEDEGIYILEVLNKDFNIEKAYVELNVNKNVRRPIVKVTDNRFRGGTSVIFTCVSRDTDISTRWIFNYTNLELTERMTLSPTKCGLKIDPFMKEDTGVYQCEVSNQFSLKTSFPVFWP